MMGEKNEQENGGTSDRKNANKNVQSTNKKEKENERESKIMR